MQFGYFTMPSHPPERSLKDGHEWDLQVIRWLDELGSPEAAMVMVFVTAERNVTATELDELGIPTAEVRSLANQLVAAGRLTQSARRGLNPTD